MSELALTSSLSPPSVPALRWLDLPDAAALCGQSERNLRRRCGEEWLSRGFARMYSEPGIKPRWQIRSDADPAFTPRPMRPESIASAAIVADLRHVPAEARAQAQERARILAEWERAVSAGAKLQMDRDRATEIFLDSLPAGEKIGRSTIYNWHRQYKRAGLSGLIDGRVRVAAEAAKMKNADPFLEQVKAYYLDQRKRKLTSCYEMALLKAQENGWQIVGERSARRFMADFEKKNPGIVLQMRYGEKAFEDTIETFIERDYSTIDTNDIWNADHHEFDVLVKVGEKLNPKSGEVVPIYKRPWLTAWQDMRSRKIVGWVIRAADPNTDTILDSFRRACRSHGVPKTAYTDNGKDFDSRAFTGQTKAQRWQRRTVKIEHDQKAIGGVFAALKMKHIHALPYHGQSKPIERFFGTLENRFGRNFETYCGSNPQNKPEDLPDQLARGKAPTLEDFEASFAEWLETDYHNRIHTGDAMDCTPNEAFAANLCTKRTAPDELLDLIIRRDEERTVQQNGVVFEGLWYGQGVLSPYLGQSVYIHVDERDLSQIMVSDADRRFLCIAKCNTKTPVNASREQLLLAKAEKSRQRKAIRAGREARLHIAESLTDTMNRAARARNENRPAARFDPPPSPNISPIRSDLESHLPGLREAMPLKKAVGDDTPSPAGFSYSAGNQQQDTSDVGGFSRFIYHGRSSDVEGNEP